MFLRRKVGMVSNSHDLVDMDIISLPTSLSLTGVKWSNFAVTLEFGVYAGMLSFVFHKSCLHFPYPYNANETPVDSKFMLYLF
jgi:hypothetical protein